MGTDIPCKTVLMCVCLVRRTLLDTQGAMSGVSYTLRKDTPFGEMKTTAKIDMDVFQRMGAERVDGQMFKVLGERLNRAEAEELLKYGANSTFGTELQPT